MLSRKRESSQLMSEREFEEFWQNVDYDRHRGGPAQAKLLRQSYSRREEEEEDDDDEATVIAHPQESGGRTAKAARCGSCDACRAKDCGECKNCLDKPRFGGPGVKKKACVNRVCLNADASPPLRPLVCKEAVPSLEGLPDGLMRHPLLPLDSQPLAAANLYSAPTPSTGAATNRSKLELLLASHGISLYR
jgi:hypothetical protein